MKEGALMNKKKFIVLSSVLLTISLGFLLLWLISSNQYESARKSEQNSLLASRQNNAFNYDDIRKFDLRINGEKIDFITRYPVKHNSSSFGEFYIEPPTPEGYILAESIVYQGGDRSAWTLRTTHWFTIVYNGNKYPINIPVVNYKSLGNDIYYYTDKSIKGRELTVGPDKTSTPNYYITNDRKEDAKSYLTFLSSEIPKYSVLKNIGMISFIVFISLTLVSLSGVFYYIVQEKKYSIFANNEEASQYYMRKKTANKQKRKIDKKEKNEEKRLKLLKELEEKEKEIVSKTID